MNLLFIADPLESFKIHKDTTFAMMREAQNRGHTIAACEPQDVMWQRGALVTAHVRDITLTGDADRWFEERGARAVPLKDLDAILMRKDPPFDTEYIYATYILERAEDQGALVVNRPRGRGVGSPPARLGPPHARGCRSRRCIRCRRADPCASGWRRGPSRARRAPPVPRTSGPRHRSG